MTIWLPNIAGRAGPKHRVLAEAIGDAIAEGTLGPGSRLPPQRDLAYALGLSLGTVTRAYKDAERRGLLVGEVGRGTYVRSRRGPSAGPTLWRSSRRADGAIGLVMNLPPAGIAAAALAGTLADLSGSESLGAMLDHGSEELSAAHRRSATKWIGRLGLGATADEIVLTNGAQHGILAALMALVRPGDPILVEALSYPPLRQMAVHLDLRLIGLDTDGEGILPDHLDAACRKSGARVLYCMPTLQSPTGATMSEARRRAIAGMARRHGLTIVEDDVFGFLPEHRPPPLAAFAQECTVFVTSVSKSMAPGLRIGFVRAPDACRDAVREAVRMSCWMPSPITAEVVHRWITDGTADRLNAWLRAEMAERCAMAHGILGDAACDQQGLRFHLWVKLPEIWTEAAFQAAAADRSVGIATGETFNVRAGPAPNGVRLALGYETSRERLAHGLSVVADLLEKGDAGRRYVV